MNNQDYTISIFTENKTGLLSRVTGVFTRRKLNILSITASESEMKGVYRYTIVLNTTLDIAEKVVKQLEKQVDVLKAFFHDEEEIIHQEIALYKISTKVAQHSVDFEKIIRKYNVRILAVTEEFLVLEMTGHPEKTQLLFELLEPHGILEFVRSGRVAITKPMRKLASYLKELEESTKYTK